jgi:hypothetical protein
MTVVWSCILSMPFHARWLAVGGMLPGTRVLSSAQNWAHDATLFLEVNHGGAGISPQGKR